MSAKPKQAKKSAVVLLRPEGGKQDFHLPAGATLGDLLRAANINPENQSILIDGKSVEDLVDLEPGMVVSVAPRPGIQSKVGSWREGLGMFHDDPTFLEMVEAVEKSREAEKDRS